MPKITQISINTKPVKLRHEAGNYPPGTVATLENGEFWMVIESSTHPVKKWVNIGTGRTYTFAAADVSWLGHTATILPAGTELKLVIE